MKDSPPQSPATQREPGSFRDPAGFVFRRDGILLRQVNRSYAEHYERLMQSGLYGELIERRLLVSHRMSGQAPLDAALAHCVIEPEVVPFVSYPYEWCFGQLKAAALATLEIQRRALQHGLTLKDASAFNIAWRGCRPCLIDTLSFETYRPGQPWTAYRQFCQHFLAPLALMRYCDAQLGSLSRLNLDGVPLDLASRLLPRRTWFNLGLLMHVHCHARGIRRYERATHREMARERNCGSDCSAGNQVAQDGSAEPHSDRAEVARHEAAQDSGGAGRQRGLTLPRLQMLIEHLEATVRRLRLPEKASHWSAYYDALHNYAGEALQHKERMVAELLASGAEAERPKVVWDLGANDGRFSRIAAGVGAYTVSWDLDRACVERNFAQACRDGEPNLHPLILDLANPSPGLGWNHLERASLADRGPADVVLALGLVHHLAIGNNVPWEHMAEFFARLGRVLIVEFVPKGDSQVQRLLASREDVFADYHAAAFERAFNRYFTFPAGRSIPGTERTLYRMERRLA